MDSIKRFMNDECGADLIEYALLVGLISLAAMTALTGVGTSVKTIWTNISTTLGAHTTAGNGN